MRVKRKTEPWRAARARATVTAQHGDARPGRPPGGRTKPGPDTRQRCQPKVNR